MQVIACLDVRANDKGDLVVTKGDQYDVREQSNEKEVCEISKNNRIDMYIFDSWAYSDRQLFIVPFWQT